MSTSPIPLDRIIDQWWAQRRRPLAERLELAASILIWIAATFSLIALLAGAPHLWVRITVLVMLTIGLAALFAIRWRRVSARIDAAVQRILGR